MEINEYPIGQELTAVSVTEDKEFKSDELCFDKVHFIFKDTAIILTPIIDTDEIEISQESNISFSVVNTPVWCKHFLGKKLMTLWVCENDQGYRDQVIFAFDNLRPSISFVAEGSAIKAFRQEPVRVVDTANVHFHNSVSH